MHHLIILENRPSKVAKLTPLKDLITDDGWKALLSSEFEQDYFKSIEDYVSKERSSGTVYPPHEETFNAFNFTPLENVKVVILGQDPYFNEGQAHGLCFSVRKGVKVPPSLNRIYKVLERDITGFKKPKHGCLEEWAYQGVLLINATLTVRKGKANTHANCGWQKFTDEVIRRLCEHKENLIFFLWGGFAQKKGAIIDSEKHHVLSCNHPSPMSGGEFNCDHFVRANEILTKLGKPTIDWKISE